MTREWETEAEAGIYSSWLRVCFMSFLARRVLPLLASYDILLVLALASTSFRCVSTFCLKGIWFGGEECHHASWLRR